MVGVQTEGTCESVNKYLSQMTSAVSSTKALYPASVDQRRQGSQLYVAC